MARKILRQIERLEADIAAFHDKDQKLYTHWDNSTFRPERERIARNQDEFEYLCKFHNWMIAVSRMTGMTLDEALLYLRAEEERYDEATPAEKSAIECARREREEFLKEESYRETTEEIEEEEQEEDDEFDLMHEMSDDELLDLMPTGEDVCDLLARVYNYRRCKKDLQLFARIWSLLSVEMREYVEDSFGSTGRNSLKELLKRLQRQGIHTEPPPPQKPEDKPAREAESLRQLYHRLVRQLHPDLNESTPWHQRIWERVQQAHRSGNRFELEKLARLVLVRGRNLNDLRVSEIIESQEWLKAELESLRREARVHRKSPAWRFSKRKDFQPVVRKIKRSLEQELSYISKCVRELRYELDLREEIARSR